MLYSYLLLGPEDTSPTIGGLTIFNLYVWDSCKLVQVLRSTSAAYSKSHGDADALVAVESMRRTYDGFWQDSDVEMVYSIPKFAPA